MGMFDTVEVDESIKLTSFKELRSIKIDPRTLNLQTKSLDNTLSHYVLKNKSLYQDSKKIKFHGVLDFYGSHLHKNKIYFVEYRAKFTDGVLQNIKLTKKGVESYNKPKEIKLPEPGLFEKFLGFIMNVFVIFPLKVLGCNLKQVCLGCASNNTLYIKFNCPKIIFLYRKICSSKVFGFAIENIDTHITYSPGEGYKTFSLKVLGFGVTISKYKNILDRLNLNGLK